MVRRCTIKTERGTFAALEARPDRGVCERCPALLLPGYTGSKEDFLPVLQPLAAAGRRVVAIDMRGQYESEAAADPDDYRPQALAADVTAVAREVGSDGGPPGVHLLGHSLGGLIARQAVLDDPAPLLSLTLLGSGPASLPSPRADALRSTLEVLGGDASPGELDRGALHRDIVRLWAERLGPQAAADGVPPHIVAFLRERTVRNCPLGLVMMGRYLLDCPDQTAKLAGLRHARILVVYGENDDAWPPVEQDMMARRLRAQRICIPGAAHSPAIEAPATTASTLSAFWNEAERAEARRRPAARQRPGDARQAGAETDSAGG